MLDLVKHNLMVYMYSEDCRLENDMVQLLNNVSYRKADQLDMLEMIMYNLIVSIFPTNSSSFKLGQAFMCSELLGIPFDQFLSDVGLTEDEFISFF